jgi:hypothetical protein
MNELVFTARLMTMPHRLQTHVPPPSLLAPAWLSLAIFWVICFSSFNAVAESTDQHSTSTPPARVQCLPDQIGFLRAKLQGSINRELSWAGSTLDCTGSVRPEGEGVRLRFSQATEKHAPLTLLFGISKLHPSESGAALPVNVTVIVEGQGQFFATQSENKCTLDEVKQTPLSSMTSESLAYQITARGFCTQPAREVNGDRSILMSWFDFSGRIDLDNHDTSTPSAEQP